MSVFADSPVLLDPGEIARLWRTCTLVRDPDGGWAPTAFPGQQADPSDLVKIAEALASLALRRVGTDRPARRRWELVAASEAFEAWVIVWPPGGSIDLHDHGGSCGAVTVAEGELVETSVASTYSGELALRKRTLRTGATLSIDDRRIHDVVNVSRAHAISVHVYAPRLTSMTYYSVAGGKLEAHNTVGCAHRLQLRKNDLRGPFS
jgi:predicted metal-dependent enzyme (double-stranded beta helix superfamily)